MDLTRYAIGGVAPRRAERPATREEAREALRAAARDRLGVVPWGGGVSLPAEAAPARYDVALDLSALAAVVEYEPDDLTLTAECGATLGALRAAVAAHGHELPLEAARADRATLGGVLAANASGPRRRRFGAPRDRVLGARYLLGDGGEARTGGKVVKNVAGYGLHRLLCGSRGALAVILEASLKLQPAPAARLACVFGCDADRIRDRDRCGAFARLEVAVLSVMSAELARAAGLDPQGADYVGVVGLEDDPARVAEQQRAVLAAYGEPMARLEGAAAAALWQRIADLEETPGTRLTFTTADDSPAAVSPLLARVPAAPFLFHAPAGRLLAWTPEPEAPGLVGALAEFGAVPIARRGLAAPAWSGQAAVRAMRERLREALDPGGRFAGGEAWVQAG